MKLCSYNFTISRVRTELRKVLLLYSLRKYYSFSSYLQPPHYFISCILEVDFFKLSTSIWYIWSQKTAYFFWNYIYGCIINYFHIAMLAQWRSEFQWEIGAENDLKNMQRMFIAYMIFLHHNMILIATKLFHFMKQIIYLVRVKISHQKITFTCDHHLCCSGFIKLIGAIT